MSKFRKQHYVPKFLLKKFSSDGKNIGIYLKDKNLYKGSLPFADQCYKDYFYGKDGDIEQQLSKMEYEASILFNQLESMEKKLFLSEDIQLIVFFLVVQQNRTKASTENYIHKMDVFYKKLLSGHPDIKDNDLEKLRLNVPNASLYQLYFAGIGVHFLIDLKCKVLINNTNEDFVLSDNPVFMCNPFAEKFQRLKKIKEKMGTGLSEKGLMILMPLTPKKYIVLYDSATYKVGNKKGIYHIVKRKDDVKSINLMQSNSASFCVYYKNINNISSTFRVNKDAERLSQDSVESIINKKGEYQLLKITNRKGNYIRDLQFFKIISRESYSEYLGSCMPQRYNARALMREVEKEVPSIFEED